MGARLIKTSKKSIKGLSLKLLLRRTRLFKKKNVLRSSPLFIVYTKIVHE